ncbi:MAG: hypothetical protein ACM3JI_01860, partial [Anaerolineae bacterium]
ETKSNCIKKKLKKLKGKVDSQNKQNDFDFYFDVQGRILNLVINYIPSSGLWLKTAYYPLTTEIKNRLGLQSAPRFEKWLRDLPQILLESDNNSLRPNH